MLLYAIDSINNARHSADYRVLRNIYLRNVLLSIKQFERNKTHLPIIRSSAQIRYKSNGWSVCKNYEKIKHYRKNNPDFFCVADMTKPVFAGDYAIIVVDHQFNPLGGGGYMHIFKRIEGAWKTYALINLWNH
jgi:hypothetical protein